MHRRALSTAAFKLAELVALAQFIAGAECKDRAHAYAATAMRAHSIGV